MNLRKIKNIAYYFLFRVANVSGVYSAFSIGELLIKENTKMSVAQQIFLGYGEFTILSSLSIINYGLIKVIKKDKKEKLKLEDKIK